LKRIGYIYEKIYDIENIKVAIKNASKKKRNQIRVQKIINNDDFYAKEISKSLKNMTFKTSEYVINRIKDGANKKERIIYKPKFYPDQIVHWALMQQIQPIIMKGMYEYSCGSIPGRGTSYGQKHLRNWLDKDHKNTKYCLKMDVKKFYPSVDNETLKNKFRNKIKDEKCLWLINKIINSAKGLPIGNYTSQWFSNFYLQDLDHFIKEKLKVKYYMRYVDDLVLLGSNKKKLHIIKRKIDKFLKKEKLIIKDNWQVFKLSCRDIDFLGLRFFRNKTILRKRNSLRIRRRFKKISKKDNLNFKDACAIISYWGWIKRSDSYNFYQKHMKPYVSLKEAKKVVSKHAKIRNNRKRET